MSELPTARTDWDRITAISAVLIGLVAVVVAAYTALLQREQIRAQVWPRLLLYNAGVAGEFHLANKGVGPALIRSVRMTVDGRPVKHWGEVARRLGVPDGEQLYSSLSSMVLAAGDDVTYLKPSTHERFVAIREHAGKRLRMDICYCSTLSECWTTNNYGSSLDDVQREVDRCPAAGPDEFEN